MITANMQDLMLNSIEEAIEDIHNGKIVIIVDDEDRENEGDFVCAAECITPEIINFMATHGRGLICTPITKQRALELDLNPMVQKNTDLHGTAFTVSIDYKHRGCSTGISAYDRATGIKAIIDSSTRADDFARPGHIFPLIAKEGGVLRRTGHTEAIVDLAKLAGFYPAGVLVEILNADGTMARLPQLFEIAKKFELKIITIKDLVAYRMQQERLVEKKNSVELETEFGTFELIAFKERNTNQCHMAIKMGDWDQDEPVLTRVHAGSNTAELFAALNKSTSQFMKKTLHAIAEEGKGVLLLIRYKEEEDLMIKTIEMLKNQQSKNENLNPFSKADKASLQKDIGIGAQILNEMGIRKINLLTNNPRKRVGLIGYGIQIVKNTPLD